jgi:hypothetical protein
VFGPATEKEGQNGPHRARTAFIGLGHRGTRNLKKPGLSGKKILKETYRLGERLGFKPTNNRANTHSERAIRNNIDENRHSALLQNIGMIREAVWISNRS